VSFSSSRAFGSRTGVPSTKRSNFQLRKWNRRIPRLRSSKEVSDLSTPDGFALTSCRNSTVGDVARKVMGDVPINYVEGVGGTRVSEEDIVAVGKHDVSTHSLDQNLP
jgi:hypothetical protein